MLQAAALDLTFWSPGQHRVPMKGAGGALHTNPFWQSLLPFLRSQMSPSPWPLQAPATIRKAMLASKRKTDGT
jgi:hypothetical protein